jgi:hypothetical protein
MKKIWKIVLLISVIMCVAGIICGGVSYLLGGSVDALYQNSAAAPVLDMLSPINILNSIYAFFGI